MVGTLFNKLDSRLLSAILVIIILLVLITALLFYFTYQDQKALISAQENRYESYLLAAELRQSSDTLTRLVRSAVITGEPRFEEQFNDVFNIRNGKAKLPMYPDRIYWDYVAVEDGNPPYPSQQPSSLISRLHQLGITPEEMTLLELSKRHSDELFQQETTAIHASKGLFADGQGEFTIRQPANRELAIRLLFSEQYHQKKIKIKDPINRFYQSIDQRTGEQVADSAATLQRNMALQVLTYLIMIALLLILTGWAWRYHRGLISLLETRVSEKTRNLKKTNRELKTALDEIKTLRGIIPICSWCHSIRNDEGAWKKLEIYIHEHTEANFSHSICPDCWEQHSKATEKDS